MQLQRTRLNVVSHKPLLWQQSFNHVHLLRLDFGTRGTFVLFPLYEESCGEEPSKHVLRLENAPHALLRVCSYNMEDASSVFYPQLGTLS